MASKWVISPTYKWGITGLEPTDPNPLLTSWDILVGSMGLVRIFTLHFCLNLW